MVASSTASNLEREDHTRDAAFNKAMHGNSAQARGGIAAMFKKGGSAKQAAVDEYFKHWDNKPAENETDEERAVWPPLPLPLSSILPPPSTPTYPWDLRKAKSMRTQTMGQLG